MTEQAVASPAQVASELMAAVGRHDLDALWERAHPDLMDDFVAIGEYRGRTQVRGFFADLFAAFPDFGIEVVSMVSDERCAVVQWRATGTFTGRPFQGVHATGRPVVLRGCDVMEFEEGKLRRNTIYYDGLGFARQIGMLPREGSSADKAMTAAFNAGVDVRARLRKVPPQRTGGD